MLDSTAVFLAELVMLAGAVMILIVAFVLIRRHNRAMQRIRTIVNDETRQVLLILDKELAKLPPKEIERFTKSKDFELYKTVMERIK